MENQYGITIRNKYDLFLDEDDPLEILKQQEVKNAAKKAEKTKKSTEDKDPKSTKPKQAPKPIPQTVNPEVKISEKSDKTEGKQQRPVKTAEESKPLRDRNNRQNNKSDAAIPPVINTTTEFGVFESQPGEKRLRKAPPSGHQGNNEPRSERQNNERTGFQSSRGPRNDEDRQGGNRPPFKFSGPREDRSGPREDRVFRNSDRPFRDNRPPRRQGFARTENDTKHEEGDENTEGKSSGGGHFGGGFNRKPAHDDKVEGTDENVQEASHFQERRGGFGQRRGGFGNYDENRPYRERRGFGNRRFGNENDENGEHRENTGERREFSGYRGRGNRRGRGGYRNNEGFSGPQNEEGREAKGEFPLEGESFGHWESPKDEEGRPQRSGGQGRRFRGAYGGKREFNRHSGQDAGGKPAEKKEKSTDCDSALIPRLCVHG